MATLKYCVTFFLALVTLFGLLSLATGQAEAVPAYAASYCTNDTAYAPNSTFQNNLNILFYYFAGNISQPDGYYLTIVGFSTSDAVQGLFLCRADVKPTLCQQCVAAAAKEIIRRCPNQKLALIWYDECMLRYGNRYFMFNSIVPRENLKDGRNISGVDLGMFNRSLFNLLNDLATKAANSQSTKKFATGEMALTSSVTLYGMEQCTYDLTNTQCEECLRNAIGTLPTCCGGQQGARALLSSCNVRYELFPFYTPASPSSGKRKLGPGTVAIIVVLPIVSLILFGLGCYHLKRRSRKKYTRSLRENFGDETGTLESLQFNLATIEAATNKFSLENKIGRGGFGEVYKGVLSDGREIAVKKLSKSSGQGTTEFKNEILLIAKLQHRNLVTLLGFCSEEEEKMLIYEYVPNKSLDYFLFDKQKRRVLNWFERYKIIGGIARGIYYLHEQSRLKIIHRDLKPSNVLLDDFMNPKISDFGMAKLIAIDQDRGRTNRIVGTYGYMSPEYAMHGQFSEKSDVFSFGVIILEIISAKRNARRPESQDLDDLLSFAWRKWRNQTPLEILDPDLKESFAPSEVTKCIQIGLLCVQENPDDRPTMERVVSYLSSVSVELPFPREPALFMNMGMRPYMIPMGPSSGTTSKSTPSSINDMSMSNFFPR